MLFFYAEGTEHCRNKGQTPPPNQRAGVPADHGAGGLITVRGTRRPWAGALITARGMRRPWGGRACCSPRGAPTMGRAGLSLSEGRADHGRARLLQPKGRGRTCRNFFPIVSLGRAYEAGNAKRGSAGRAGKHGAQQGVQGVCKAKAWQNEHGDFLRSLDRSAL